jgi:hypothetical protein
MPLSVEYADLSLAQQVLERQSSEHLANMRSFLKQWGDYSDGGEGAGLLMMAFNPLNQEVVHIGDEVLGLLEQAHGGAADHMGQTLEAYVNADQQIHAALASVTEMLGGSSLPFNDPRSSLPTLGAAARGASQWYGGAEPNLAERMAQGVMGFGEYASDFPGRLTDRANKALSGNRSISESQDASSYLVPPESPESEMKNLRWSAGVVIGGVDWLIEKLTGVSVLNDIIFKYTVGDWRVLDRASTAWSEIGDALVAVGQNDSEILPALSEWTGKGSEAANAFIAALAGVTTALNGAAGSVSGIIKNVSKVVKQAAKLIGKQLKRLQDKCLRMIAEASVPVAGWIVAAGEAVKAAQEIYDMVKKIHFIINLIYTAIENMAQAKAQIIEIRYTISNIAEAAARGAAARV